MTYIPLRSAIDYRNIDFCRWLIKILSEGQKVFIEEYEVINFATNYLTDPPQSGANENVFRTGGTQLCAKADLNCDFELQYEAFDSSINTNVFLYICKIDDLCCDQKWIDRELNCLFWTRCIFFLLWQLMYTTRPDFGYFRIWQFNCIMQKLRNIFEFPRWRSLWYVGNFSSLPWRFKALFNEESAKRNAYIIE